jgi:hypothetical protein
MLATGTNDGHGVLAMTLLRHQTTAHAAAPVPKAAWQVGAANRLRTALKWTAGAVGFAAAASASYVGIAWLRYGHPEPPNTDDADALLERFMPIYDVAERRHIAVAAPADVTFIAACEADLMQSPIIRAIFKARELVLGAEPDSSTRAPGALAFTKSTSYSIRSHPTSSCASTNPTSRSCGRSELIPLDRTSPCFGTNLASSQPTGQHGQSSATACPRESCNDNGSTNGPEHSDVGVTHAINWFV